MNNNNFSTLIIDKFTKKFTAAYKELNGSGKTKILKYSPIIFKRWFYSALVNETTLSPSFIYSAGSSENGVVTAPTVTPRLSGSQFKDFILKENRYSVRSHPVVNDLACFIDFCMPDIELDENNLLSTENTEKLSMFLSLSDPFYVEFLTYIAFNLRLIKKSAAIYSNKAAVSNNYMSFLELNQEDALKKIVDATIKLSAQNITAALPQSLPLVSEKGILALIKKPVSIDEIFKKIFNSFGVDIEHIWDNFDKANDKVDEGETAIISSTFFLGITLDKWFITPFGEYLKIIEPIYCFSYNFEDELNYLWDVIKGNGDISTALYSPCALYSFTAFGKLLFAAESNGGGRAKPANVSVSDLLDLLNIDNAPVKKDAAESNTKEAKIVFSFRVKLMEDKRFWKQIDAADYNTLHELHLEIAVDFGFGLLDYSFFTSETLSPFCKYVAPKTKGKHHKADKITIVELSLIKGNKLIYISDSGQKLELELTKCMTDKSNSYYPQTIKQSKYMAQKK